MRTDLIVLCCVTFISIYLMYLLITQLHFRLYIRQYGKKPLHYRMFRLYSSQLFSNAPSKHEKRFYTVANKITWVFNTLTIVAFFIFLYILFLR